MSADLGQAFLNGDPIDGVAYFHNDFVRVVAGEDKGAAGSLVTVLSLQPEPRFVLELESGFDAEVVQSEIERADDAQHREVGAPWLWGIKRRKGPGIALESVNAARRSGEMNGSG